MLEPVAKTDEALRVFPEIGPHGRVAVVDIGSNSVRMVVYEGLARALVPLFNEKVLCGLGRGLGKTGKLSEEGIELALSTLRRFKAIAGGLHVETWFVVATAAARDADNGSKFVAEARAALHTDVRVLTGAEEAELAALGVAGSMRNTIGVVGDLGGGSLELSQIDGHRILNRETFKLGPFPLMEYGAASSQPVKDEIMRQLDRVEWLKNLPENSALYVVGGAWRTLGRVHMAQDNYALRMLHQYEIPTIEARNLSQVIAGLGPETLSAIKEVPSRRVETLPFAAQVLDRVLQVTHVNKVIFSAHGVREGVLYDQLSPEEFALDPLLSNCRAMSAQFDRPHRPDGDHFGDELQDWMAPLFPDETPDHTRRRHAAAILSDIAWRTPSDYRGEQAFAEIMRGPLVGVRHVARGQIALSVLYRYTGSISSNEAQAVADTLPEETHDRARKVGLAMRLGITLSGSLSGILPHCPLRRDEDRLTLVVPRRFHDFIGEVTDTRLKKVADLDGLDYGIEKVDR